MPDAASLRATFERAEPFTVGLEEELLLLDPVTYDLAPVATEVLARAGDDARFKLELPAAQLEIATRPHASVGDAIAELAGERADLVRVAGGLARPAAAALHPFADPDGELNSGERYDATAHDYASVARLQVVGALQVHVAVGGADRSLAVYNALRGYLPLLAALAAASPWHAGRDTGLASFRPMVGGMLPRQGVPPAIESWEAWARELAWGAASGAVPEIRRWWFELRPHAAFGTLELRVPDVQATVGEAAAVAAVGQALVAWLAARFDAGEALPAHHDWRIAENRWAAARHGVEGTLADLDSGERRPTRALLHELLDDLEPHAAALGCAGELASARALVDVNGAMRLRRVAADEGPGAAAAYLAERFLEGVVASRPGPSG